MHLEIVEKVERMITSSTELKGLGLKPQELAVMRDNVATQMYEDINDSIDLGEDAMVPSIRASPPTSTKLGVPSCYERPQLISGTKADSRIRNMIRLTRSFLTRSSLDSMFPGSFWIRSSWLSQRIMNEPWPSRRCTCRCSLRDPQMQWRRRCRSASQRRNLVMPRLGALRSRIHPAVHSN